MKLPKNRPIEFTATHKECRKCGVMKVYKEFHKCKSGPCGLAYWCKICACRNSRKHHKLRVSHDVEYKKAKRASYIKSMHGITLNEYEAMLAKQNHKCDICQVELLSHGTGTHLDHCHKSGRLRAMLCTNCNRGLGHFQDGPTLLYLAARYLCNHMAVG